MNVQLAVRLGGWLMIALGGFQILPLLAALFFGEPFAPYLAAGLFTIAAGLPGVLLVKPQNLRIRPRDGFLIVSGAWLLAAAAGAIPYMTSGVLGPVDALFESMSGFTTTGSTVLTDIEASPHALLLWRSLTQWIGGMGIVVFTIALMPILGIGGMQLFKAEVPGPVTEKIRPRVAQTARALWMIYVGLTVLQWIALMLAGMTGFDALCHALTTLSTGGFSTRNASIAAFHSPLIEWIVIVFMMLAGMNFVLHYRALTGRFREIGRDAELRYFLAVVALSFGLIWLADVVLGAFVTGPPGFRDVLFTVVSIVTTTGFATADFETWPSVSHLLLLGLMLLGAMAGSTSGGVKSLRALLAMRAVRGTFRAAGHRNAVQPPVMYGGRPVSDEVITSIWVFLAVYFALAGAMAVVVAAAGYDMPTAISGGLTSIGNVGPGLGEIGPYDHFAHFPSGVKLGFIFCMLAGRLELFTLLVLFSASYWRR
jgi:trk system potassium uptake protein TrkH